MTITLQFETKLYIEKCIDIDNIDDLPQVEDEMRDTLFQHGVMAALKEADGYDIGEAEEAWIWSEEHNYYVKSVDEFIDIWHDYHDTDECDTDDEEVSDDAGDDEGNTADISQEAATRLFQSLLTF